MISPRSIPCLSSALGDNERDIKMPFQMLARLQLAGGLQKFIAIKSVVLCCVALRKRR